MNRFSPQRAGDDVDGAGPDPGSRELARAFHRVTISMHTSPQLADTLSLITRGVTELTCFRVAALNLVRPSGDYEVVAVAGPDEVRETLLGVRVGAAEWDALLAQSVPWGALRWIDHRSSVEWPSVPSWTPDAAAVGAREGDPDAWHPDDSLVAPLVGPTGQRLGALSVDLPAGGRKPTAAQLELLELFADSAAMAVAHSRLLDTIRRQHEQSHHMATHDALTGLANRAALESATEQLLASGPDEVGMLVIDLDRFKAVNDSFGHSAGDEVLVAVARRMTGALRGCDVAARTGGDEFAVLVGGSDVSTTLQVLATRLRVAITAPVRGELGRYRVGASIGAASARPPVTLSDLLRAADADMYRAKRAAS